jgi:hypothetical protein
MMHTQCLSSPLPSRILDPTIAKRIHHYKVSKPPNARTSYKCMENFRPESVHERGRCLPCRHGQADLSSDRQSYHLGRVSQTSITKSFPDECVLEWPTEYARAENLSFRQLAEATLDRELRFIFCLSLVKFSACSFLCQMDNLGEENYWPNPVLEKALDVLFLLHADHELNASATTVLQTGSSLVDPYSAIA